MSAFRAATRLILLGLLFLFAFLHFIFFVWLPGNAGSIPVCARWMQCWSRNFLWILQGKVTVRGEIPARGILVSNHLSYVDVLVYGGIRPFVFLSKSEVRSWPIVGPLTRFAGTLYIQRQNKSDVARLADQMKPVVDANVMITMFLEGTSTDGATVLPFRSGLLSSVAEHNWPVTPAWIHYTMKEGSVADEICYWRDMTFFPHLFNLLKRKGFQATVCFDNPLTTPMDRKALAQELHIRVCRMKDAEMDPNISATDLTRI